MKNLIFVLALLCLTGCSWPKSQTQRQGRIGTYEYGAYYQKQPGQKLFLMSEVTLHLKPNGHYLLCLDQSAPNKVSYSGRYTITDQKVVLHHAKGVFKGTFKGDDIVLDPRKLNIQEHDGNSIAEDPGQDGKFLKQ